MYLKKHIAILGSTGSIGTQTLDVVEEHNQRFVLEVITANNNIELLEKQARKYKPKIVVTANKNKYKELKEKLKDTDIQIYAGAEAISDLITKSSIDTVVTAMVGYAGLEPTIRAIEAGKNIALANKETLVVAGDIITKVAKKNNVNIYPIDSEHSAIYQCLIGEEKNSVEKIYLTASGGPFRGKNYDFLKKVTKAQALKHPNWNMGAKITIDSATLMNKGLEVIEAHWLFGLSAKQIDVIVHPQSVIHSIVQFRDGSMKAQMGLPNMKIPIQYALGFPERMPSKSPRFNFTDYPKLTFEKADFKTFPNIQLAYTALEMGGNMPCILNAANEIAVDAFLKEKISFVKMPEIIEKTMAHFTLENNLNYEDYIYFDKEARIKAKELLNDK